MIEYIKLYSDLSFSFFLLRICSLHLVRVIKDKNYEKK